MSHNVFQKSHPVLWKTGSDIFFYSYARSESNWGHIETWKAVIGLTFCRREKQSSPCLQKSCRVVCERVHRPCPQISESVNMEFIYTGPPLCFFSWKSVPRVPQQSLKWYLPLLCWELIQLFSISICLGLLSYAVSEDQSRRSQLLKLWLCDCQISCISNGRFICVTIARYKSTWVTRLFGNYYFYY